jgi:hypothetical protein
MNIYALIADKMYILTHFWGWLLHLQLVSFYSICHQPLIKQVHFRALTTILPWTKEFLSFLFTLFRKHKNTGNGIP